MIQKYSAWNNIAGWNTNVHFYTGDGIPTLRGELTQFIVSSASEIEMRSSQGMIAPEASPIYTTRTAAFTARVGQSQSWYMRYMNDELPRSEKRFTVVCTSEDPLNPDIGVQRVEFPGTWISSLDQPILDVDTGDLMLSGIMQITGQPSTLDAFAQAPILGE
jgi:hypothetical protein